MIRAIRRAIAAIDYNVHPGPITPVKWPRALTRANVAGIVNRDLKRDDHD
jgi:hypothetical protein